MHVVFQQPDPWAFGWDALVAIFTGWLALGTFTLAVATAKLARGGRVEFEAQWRPILSVTFVRGLTSDTLPLGVRNIGRGPALNVRMEAPPSGARNPHPLQSLEVGGDRNVALQADDGWVVAWVGRRFVALLACEDVLGKTHYTSATLEYSNDFADWTRAVELRLVAETACGLEKPGQALYAGLFERIQPDPA